MHWTRFLMFLRPLKERTERPKGTGDTACFGGHMGRVLKCEV